MKKQEQANKLIHIYPQNGLQSLTFLLFSNKLISSQILIEIKVQKLEPSKKCKLKSKFKALFKFYTLNINKFQQYQTQVFVKSKVKYINYHFRNFFLLYQVPLQQLHIMNVDSDNFHEVRKFITQKQLIEKSKYISFDLEFTGVRFDNNQRDKYDMFLNDKYSKMMSVANKFSIIQVGITFVVPEETESQKENQEKQQQKMAEEQEPRFTAYPFNFYIFPRETNSNDPVVSMQAGCIKFNTANSMDWNRWIRKGITYVKISEMHKVLQNLYNSSVNSAVTITNTNSISSTRIFSELLNELNSKTKSEVCQIIEKCEGKDIGFQYTIEVPKNSVGHIRRAIQKYADQKQINFMLTTNTVIVQQQQEILNKIDHVHMVNLTIEIISEDKKNQEIQRQKQNLLGFTLIFQQIWNSQTTLVAHNCLYDLLFIYASLIDDLPKDYQNFKKIICDKKGRKLFDTKYLAAQEETEQKIFKKGTSLEELYKFMKDKYYSQNSEASTKKIPPITLAKGFQSYDLDKPALHQAGFDSLLTAWIFLHLNSKEENEGKLSIFKSFYFLNLRTPADLIRQDMKVFVIAIVLNNAYVAFDELKSMRITMSKNVRNWLNENDLLGDVMIVDGFKEIFLSTREISKNSALINFLYKCEKSKYINKSHIMSLQSWIKMKAQVFASNIAQNRITNNNNVNNNHSPY